MYDDLRLLTDVLLNKKMNYDKEISFDSGN